MALYHFTVKTDKRPGRSGTRVRATQHVEYINREGQYKNIDQKDASKMNNLILSFSKKDVLDGSRALLYESPYGNIINTEDGLKIENDPSLDTLAIALMVAKESMHDRIIIKGTDSFKQKCVMAAAMADLPITFFDGELQKALVAEREEIEDEKRRYKAAGGRIVRKASGGIFEPDKPDIISARKSILEAPTPETLPSLHQLSERTLARDGQSESPVLVQRDEDDELVNPGASSHPPVRRDFSRGRRRRAVKTARQILKNVNENIEAVHAQSHVEYINREKAFQKKGGCVYTAHKLPAWAKDSPNKFFKAADRYSPKGARRYQEIEFALQNELTLEQNLEIINQFIEKNMPNHYYAFAVHDKIGAMSDGTHNIHVHLMFSPCIIDDIEQKKERDISKYFQKSLRSDAKDQSEEARRKKGAPVDRRFEDSAFISKLRVSYQDITNSVLEKYGYQARIDHRSLKAQKMEAEANGDTFLASLLDRLPEEHISKYGVLDEQSPEAQNIKNYRQLKKQYQDLLYTHMEIEWEKAEKQENQYSKQLQERIQRILSSSEFVESNPDASSYIGELREEFLKNLREYDRLKELSISIAEFWEEAELEYMTPTEREQYQAYKSTLAELNHWMTFGQSIHQPETDDQEEIKAYNELLVALNNKYQELDERQKAQKELVDKIQFRLKNDSEIKKQIQLIVNRNKNASRHDWLKLQQAEQNLEVSAKTLEQALFNTEMSENRLEEYHTRELYAIMRRRYYGYKKEYEKLLAAAQKLKKYTFSIDRALGIAKDRFTKGAYSEIRKELRAVNKKLKYVENDQKKLQASIAKDGLLPEYAEQKKQLDASWNKLKNQHNVLERKLKTMDERCATPEANEKIQAIALGIMDKHSTSNRKYEAVAGKVEVVKGKMIEAQQAMNLLKVQVQKDKENRISYRINPDAMRDQGGPPPSVRTPNGGVDKPGAIMKALLNNDAVCPRFVERNTGIDDDMGLKTWKFMTEIEKMEEEEKRLYNNI